MTEDAQMKIRLPAGLKEQIEEAARRSKRSLNSEIVSRLEFTFAVDIETQESGWDVGYGLESPELKAALLKQRLTADAASPSLDGGDDNALKREVEELRRRIERLENLVRT